MECSWQSVGYLPLPASSASAVDACPLQAPLFLTNQAGIASTAGSADVCNEVLLRSFTRLGSPCEYQQNGLNFTVPVCKLETCKRKSIENKTVSVLQYLSPCFFPGVACYSPTLSIGCVWIRHHQPVHPFVAEGLYWTRSLTVAVATKTLRNYVLCEVPSMFLHLMEGS